MKKIFIASLFIGSLMTSSCSDYLDVLPKDQQSTDMYWESSDDVEYILGEGYYTLRSLTETFFDWGEIRASSTVTANSEGMKIQNFQILPSNKKVKWDNFYHIINMANQVLKYAPSVVERDDSYKEAQMKSHQTEAYFLRALSYFYLVRNFKEVPLILEPYDTDDMDISVAKSSEADLIALIKSDIKNALDSGAAKEMFNATATWQHPSKGRATKWALYALMADVCLWNEDYDECIAYTDLLINASSGMRPVFISSPMQWFSIFYPGDSNESIFEVQFSGRLNQATGSPTKSVLFSGSTPKYYFSETMTQRLEEEALSGGMTILGRTSQTYALLVGTTTDKEIGCIWKYLGTDVDYITQRGADEQDANFIIYRMADIILMKAEALICKGGTDNWEEAITLIKQIRQRANLDTITPTMNELTEEILLTEYLLPERDMEFAAEGKRWYDLLRFAKKHNGQYKQQFMDLIMENNTSANAKWLKSALQSEDAWYLPIHEDELKNNSLLVQNPYYGVTK